MQKIKDVLAIIGLFTAGVCLGAVAVFLKRRGTGTDPSRTGGDQRTTSDLVAEAGANNQGIAEQVESARLDNLNAQELNERARELIKKAKDILNNR